MATEKQVERWQEAALKFVNQCRAIAGKKPRKRLPKGFKGQGDRCPIARGIGIDDGHVGLSFATFRDKNGVRHEVKVPRLAASFIRHFDRGELPHLIRKQRGVKA